MAKTIVEELFTTAQQAKIKAEAREYVKAALKDAFSKETEELARTWIRKNGPEVKALIQEEMQKQVDAKIKKLRIYIDVES